ncbi:hypothetical protein [Proteus mirabilis]|uniref:hypothetical protein n=1 Tax=Proteus mirabilis TaxID=584 RepID=UPI0034D4CB81
MLSKSLIKTEHWSEDYIIQLLKNNIRSELPIDSMVNMLSPTDPTSRSSKCVLEYNTHLTPKMSHSLFVDELRLNNYHDFKQKNFIPEIRNGIFTKEYNILRPISIDNRCRLELKVNDDSKLCFRLNDKNRVYFENNYFTEVLQGDKGTNYVLDIDLLRKNSARGYLIAYVSMYIRSSIIRAIEINRLYLSGMLHKNELILEKQNENEVFLKRNEPKKKFFTPFLKRRIKNTYKLYNQVQDLL